jgi:carboxymethylenebutenolidase
MYLTHTYEVYYPPILSLLAGIIALDPRLVCLVAYGGMSPLPPIPVLAHIATKDPAVYTQKNAVIHTYNVSSPFFILPASAMYHSGSAAVAHSRTLVFLRKHLNGPHFDIEKVWDEHTYFEFVLRSVAKTMGTMVVSQDYRL